MLVAERIAECSPSLYAALQEFLKENSLVAKRSCGCYGHTTDQLVFDLVEKVNSIKTAILKEDSGVNGEIQGLIKLLQRFQNIDCPALLGGRTDEVNIAVLKSWFVAEVFDIVTTQELTKFPALKDFFRDRGMPQLTLWQQLAHLNAFAEWSSARAEFLRKLSRHQIVKPDESTAGGQEAFRLYNQVQAKEELIDSRKGIDDMFLCETGFLLAGRSTPVLTPTAVLSGVEATYRSATQSCANKVTEVVTLRYIQRCVSLLYDSLCDAGSGRKLLGSYVSLANYFADPLELISCSVYELDAKVDACKALDRVTRLFYVSESKRLYLVGSYAGVGVSEENAGKQVAGYVDRLDPERFGEIASIPVTPDNLRDIESRVRAALGYEELKRTVTPLNEAEITRRMEQVVAKLAFQRAALCILINWASENESKAVELTESLTCGGLTLDGAIEHVYGALLASVKQIFPEYSQLTDDEVVHAVLIRASGVVDPEEVELLPETEAEAEASPSGANSRFFPAATSALAEAPPARESHTDIKEAAVMYEQKRRIDEVVGMCTRFRTTQNIKGAFDEQELRSCFEKAITEDRRPFTQIRLMKAIIEIGAILKCDIGKDDAIREKIEALFKPAVTPAEPFFPVGNQV